MLLPGGSGEDRARIRTDKDESNLDLNREVPKLISKAEPSHTQNNKLLDVPRRFKGKDGPLKDRKDLQGEDDYILTSEYLKFGSNSMKLYPRINRLAAPIMRVNAKLQSAIKNTESRFFRDGVSDSPSEEEAKILQCAIETRTAILVAHGICISGSRLLTARLFKQIESLIFGLDMLSIPDTITWLASNELDANFQSIKLFVRENSFSKTSGGSGTGRTSAGQTQASRASILPANIAKADPSVIQETETGTMSTNDEIIAEETGEGSLSMRSMDEEENSKEFTPILGEEQDGATKAHGISGGISQERQEDLLVKADLLQEHSPLRDGISCSPTLDVDPLKLDYDASSIVPRVAGDAKSYREPRHRFKDEVEQRSKRLSSQTKLELFLNITAMVLAVTFNNISTPVRSISNNITPTDIWIYCGLFVGVFTTACAVVWYWEDQPHYHQQVIERLFMPTKRTDETVRHSDTSWWQNLGGKLEVTSDVLIMANLKIQEDAPLSQQILALQKYEGSDSWDVYCRSVSAQSLSFFPNFSKTRLGQGTMRLKWTCVS